MGRHSILGMRRENCVSANIKLDHQECVMVNLYSGLFQWCADVFTSKPPGNAVPEIDGPAGIAAIALLVSVGCILYNKSRN
jgi:hypothetical protein